MPRERPPNNGQSAPRFGFYLIRRLVWHDLRRFNFLAQRYNAPLYGPRGQILNGYCNRIARARAYLGETDVPIGPIAEKLGYNDIYFFTRQFRERVGVPPGQYRKSRQG